jgi:hypothetical protein
MLSAAAVGSRRGVGLLGGSAVYHDSFAVCSCFSPHGPPNQAQGAGVNLGPGGEFALLWYYMAASLAHTDHRQAQLVSPRGVRPGLLDHSGGMSWQTADHC